MSCGRPHETDCAEVLADLYSYLDGEDGHLQPEAIAQHLAECAPCLTQYELDRVMKAMVRRCCTRERAPAELRMRIMQRITTVRVSRYS
ncbi:MAG: mycothiol system anti-sigma-R factor [Micrococcales bacterium]|nr:MAG: mycothiol system anti-sigma-R factor [Micrococcales bacterium]PIE26267.1 MAG: mycothiol system anti-sigma-R factor [Micrococcales bacterium]